MACWPMKASVTCGQYFAPSLNRVLVVKIGVPREVTEGERRVALVPESVGRLAQVELEVLVERGAGEAAAFRDEAYAEAGAELSDRDRIFAEADVVAKVRKPSDDEVGRLRDGVVLIGLLEPLTDKERLDRLAERGVVGFAMESIPRITRAQPMDALSSQATVSGYKAVLLAADRLPRFFPMLMTAAGTVAPAKVLVLGAGVAGLQAIATARRLGAVVSRSTCARSSRSRSRVSVRRSSSSACA